MKHSNHDTKIPALFLKLSFLGFLVVSVPILSKPQAFFLQSNVYGYIQPNTRTTVKLTIKPAFACSNLSVRLRTLGDLSINGQSRFQSTDCNQINPEVQVSLPANATGFLVVDVKYSNDSETYGGSKSIRFTSTPPDQKSMQKTNNGTPTDKDNIIILRAK